jgi:hypothetical protein
LVYNGITKTREEKIMSEKSNTNNNSGNNGGSRNSGNGNNIRYPFGDYEERSVEPSTTSLNRPDVPPAKPKS